MIGESILGFFGLNNNKKCFEIVILHGCYLLVNY